MATCEECWSNAYFRSRVRGTSQVEEYYELLKNSNHHNNAVGRIVCKNTVEWLPDA